jgi:hypothetical protein
MYTDKRPLPYSLPVGMGRASSGLIVLGFRAELLAAAARFGARRARLGDLPSRKLARGAARLGRAARLAQSLFQVGGNVGSAIGPLLAAFIVLPRGQSSVSWFAAGSLVGIFILWRVGAWYAAHRLPAPGRPATSTTPPFDMRTTTIALVVLTVLTLTKNAYTASSSYYTFYLIERFSVGVQDSQTAAVRVPRRLGARRVPRRPHRRPVRREVRDLVLDPRRPALHPRPALCRLTWTVILSVIIGWSCLVGLLGDRGVRAGTAARPGGHDRRHLLRLRLRCRRHCRGGARRAGRRGFQPRCPLSSAR